MYIIQTVNISITRIFLFSSLLFYRLCNSASEKLHNGMFSGILSASLSFFDQTSPERIINDFTNDINIIDESIPQSMINTLEIILCLIGTLILICLVNVWFLITIVALIIPYAIMRYFYRNISANMEAMHRQCMYLYNMKLIEFSITLFSFYALFS